MGPQLKFFRLPGSCSEKDLELIDKSIQVAESNKIEVITISDPEAVKTLLADDAVVDQTIYVYCPFEGKIFEKLKEKGYRLIGPQCVMSCLVLELPVPKVSHPVYNVAMLNTVVCCSSMKKNERTQLHQLVQTMGGEVTAALTLNVTHLVAKEVGSKKYEVASDNNIPSVFPSWIKDAWEKSQYNHFLATDESYVKEHLIPIFQGCTICVTGIDATKRDSIQTLVTKNGGVYSAELNMKTCTHLLVEHPRGQKYAYAQQWKLHCVSPQWLYDCLKKKRWIQEKQYKVEPATDTTVVNQSALQRSNIHDTILGTSIRQSLAPNDPATKNGKTNNSKKSKSSDGGSRKSSGLEVKVVAPQTIDVKSVRIGESGSYLEECQIYLCDRPGPILDVCKKIVNNGGGIRVNMLSDSITHLVVWDQVQPVVCDFLNNIKEGSGILPHVVSPMWLFDSCKSAKSVPEDNYTLLDQQNETEDDAVFVKPKLPATLAPVKPATTLQPHFEEEFDDESTLMNQYMNPNQENMQHESTRLSQLGAPNEAKAAQNLDDMTEDEDLTATLEANTSIMERRKFMVQRFESAQVEQFRSFMEEYGAVYVEDEAQCDYIIVPLTYTSEDVEVHPKEVTVCWAEKSIECQQLLDPSSSFFFRPFYLDPNTKPLTNCVVTVSQYPGYDRDHIFHLAELLGAVSQDFFSRNDTSKTKASTHLVLEKAEGPKYEASVKWKIPCVRKEWLIACARTGKRLPEERFSLTSNSGEDDFVTMIEETNVHAWDRPTAAPLEQAETKEDTKEKSIIAAPPPTDQISFDFSTSGASLMVDTNALKTQIYADKTAPGLAVRDEAMDVTHDKSDTVIQDVSASVIPNESHTEQTNAKDKENELPSVVSNDFTAFNSFIADEKRKSAAAEKLASNVEEEETMRLPSTVPEQMSKSRRSSFFERSRYSFDFTDALDDFRSPVTSASQGSNRRSSIRRSRASLPFDVLFTEALQKAVNKHCPDDEDVFDNTEAKKEESNDNDDTKDIDESVGVSDVLSGVVLVVSKKLNHSQTDLHNLTTSLGGEVRFMYDKTCTHFVHQGKVGDMSKDYAEAKRERKHLVHPKWLQACADANIRVSEAQYPVTYNPRMSIDIKSDPPVRTKQLERKAENIDVKNGFSKSSKSTEGKDDSSAKKGTAKSLDSPKNSVPEAPGLTPPLNKTSDDVEAADMQKKMEAIMNAGKAPKNDRRPTRRQTTNTSANKSTEHCHRKMRNRTSSQKSGDFSSSTESKVLKPSAAECVNEQSQGGFITYDDPTGRLERERILEHLKRASPSQDIESLFYPVEKLASSVNGTGDNSEGKDKEPGAASETVEPKKSLSPPKPQISLPITNETAKPDVIDLLYDEEAEHELKKIENSKKYKFLFSGIGGQEKIDYGATIEKLGGVLFDVQYFNVDATHLMVKSPTKNEKFLSALACGRWVLHLSYLDASREANDFIDESDHEWGSQAGATVIALAARRWRIELTQRRLTDPNAGAFKGWVVLLCIEASKQAGFKRILESGGAKLLSARPPFDNIQGATHAFIGDKKQVAKGKVDLHALHDTGMWILKSEYIADFLINDPKPSVADYVLDEVRAFDEMVEGAPSQRKRKANDVSSTRQKRSKK